MAEVEMIDGSGYISDESEFAGDEDTRARLENEAGRKLRLPVSTSLKQPAPRDSAAPAKPATTGRPTHHDSDVLDFLKSRPQVAAMRETAAVGLQHVPRKRSADVEAAEVVQDNRFEGDPAAWQHNETVVDFLRRAPVDKPSTAALGPWLWVRNPELEGSVKTRESSADIGAFTEGGALLLTAHNAQREKLQKENPNAAAATITRKLGPYRDQLQDNLLALAVKTGTTCGKWMLFPSNDDYPRAWRLVAEATAAGKLGPTSKAATPSDMDPVNLICVYTYDFSNVDDVRRVLDQLVALGLCDPKGKAIFYKCDAYTYLGINSGNSQRLRASLFSSKEVLNNEVRVRSDGGIDRQKKRNKTIDRFFAS